MRIQAYKQKKLNTAVILIGICLLIVLSAGFNSVHAGHECGDEACLVCLHSECRLKNIRALGTALLSADGTFSVLQILRAGLVLLLCAQIRTGETLVTLAVRIDN